MSNTQRPTTARKPTRTTKAKAESALDSGLKITLDGEDYIVREGDLTDRLERELREEYGGSWEAFKRELGTDPGLDTIGTFIWLARRVAGEKVTRDDVELSRADLVEGFDIAVAGKRTEDESPEA